MKVLITGGAGYIGSVTSAHLLDCGHQLHILDDLSTGHREAVPEGAVFFEGRIQDEALLAKALDGVDAVVHFASLSLVGVSVKQPLHYFRQNLGSALSLLEGMNKAGVSRLVFSSTAAVYGEPTVDLITENSPIAPVNPYGHSKAMIERVLQEECRANGLSAITLRYFNACGADDPRGEDHEPETHLIPRLAKWALDGSVNFAIFGDDYDTPDGTALRDYIHVCDLARAHGLALGKLGEPGFDVVNLGTGTGASVREIVDAAASVLGKALDAAVHGRRDGDPPRLVASNQKAFELLGWKPERSAVTEILRDAINWHRKNPQGY